MASTTTGHASSVRCFDNADLLHRFPARSIGTVLSILPIASGIETNLLDNLAPLRDAFDSILVLRFDSILVLRRFILRRHILRRFMPAYAFFNLWHCEQSWLHGCYGCYHLTDGAPARCRLALGLTSQDKSITPSTGRSLRARCKACSHQHTYLRT